MKRGNFHGAQVGEGKGSSLISAWKREESPLTKKKKERSRGSLRAGWRAKERGSRFLYFRRAWGGKWEWELLSLKRKKRQGQGN